MVPLLLINDDFSNNNKHICEKVNVTMIINYEPTIIVTQRVKYWSLSCSLIIVILIRSGGEGRFRIILVPDDWV